MAAEGQFYRLVDGDIPTPDDFRNHFELLAAGQVRSRYWKPEKDCQAAGLSISGDLVEIKNLRQATGPLRRKKIARGTIDSSGAMKPTPGAAHKSHHTWWRHKVDDSWQRFRTVA
ncbi:MAG: hypothetical protein ACRDTA_11380 [Pseudonocardiaceae bacterium]